jgi:isopenicillin N synthase-like dioxygenase
MDSIPTIRLDDDDVEATAERLHEACKEVGFFYLAGHGIDPTLIRQVFAQSKLLFSLNDASKRAMRDPVLSRGYTAMEEETLDPARQSRGDTKEGFYIGRHIPQSDPRYDPAKLAGPNQWPDSQKCPDMEDPASFRSTMERYMGEITAVAVRVVRLLARSLQLPADYFDEDFSEPMSALRLLHYAAVSSEPSKGVFACGAHSDYGMITLLLLEPGDHCQQGLQIYTKDHKWISVPAVDNAFVVNLGDMLERWTNGLYRSTMHRVLTNGSRERYSVPFFFEPNFDCQVTCLESCCSEDNPPRYPSTTSGQHLLDKYKQTHADFTPERGDK